MVAFETIQFVGGAAFFCPEIQYELAEGHLEVRDGVRFADRECDVGILGIGNGIVQADHADHVEGGAFSPRQLLSEHGS